MDLKETAIVLACVADVLLLFRLCIVVDRKNKAIKKAEESARLMELSIKGYERERLKLKDEISEMKTGWFPATYNNTRNNYRAKFKFRYSKSNVMEQIKYYTVHGPVFHYAGLIEFSELYVKIDVS